MMIKTYTFKLETSITVSYPEGFASEASLSFENLETKIRLLTKEQIDAANKLMKETKYHEGISFSMKIE